MHYLNHVIVWGFLLTFFYLFLNSTENVFLRQIVGTVPLLMFFPESPWFMKISKGRIMLTGEMWGYFIWSI